MGKARDAYMILIGKLEGMRPLGRPRCWLVDNVKFIDWLRIGTSGGFL
jgi:hypothetical protein